MKTAHRHFGRVNDSKYLGGKRNAFGYGMISDGSNDGSKTRNWREICEQIVREKTPDRFKELLAELLKALDEERAADPANRKS